MKHGESLEYSFKKAGFSNKIVYYMKLGELSGDFQKIYNIIIKSSKEKFNDYFEKIENIIVTSGYIVMPLLTLSLLILGYLPTFQMMQR